jgi:glycosyltransferase involved in cell wall biosynthesis
MKYTVIGPTYPYKGGITHFTTTLVQNLRKKNDVDFISWKRQYPSFLYPVELKDTQSKETIETDAVFLLDFMNPITWFRTVTRIKKHSSDILMLTWASPIQAPIYFLLCILTKMLTKTKIYYICHNVLPHEKSFYDKFFIYMAFRFADAFIVHSSEDKKILEKFVNDKKIIKGFLPLYDIFKKEKNYNIQAIKKQYHLTKKVLLFFGYIRPYKGLRYLLEAMPALQKKFPDLSLLVVGEFWSKDKHDYVYLVRKLKLTESVQFIDTYVPNEELGKFFAVSDVVVLPYLSATQSAAVQTAYGFDKPVIATTVGGLKDVMAEGITGYSIRPKSSSDITRTVEKFYKEWQSNEDLKKFKTRFSWNNYFKQMRYEEN